MCTTLDIAVLHHVSVIVSGPILSTERTLVFVAAVLTTISSEQKPELAAAAAEEFNREVAAVSRGLCQLDTTLCKIEAQPWRTRELPREGQGRDHPENLNRRHTASQGWSKTSCRATDPECLASWVRVCGFFRSWAGPYKC